MINTELLKKRIDDKGLKLGYVAEQLGLSRYGLFLKLNGTNEFTISEAAKMCKILGIKASDEKEHIFFADEVD